ncbi:hypothetical protein CPARA_3gp356 (nucleomorph) [Cryptomonas paramecium]|uniref:Uncharacterized protein n=1 Tax=Cryptomonas paramaecium TaxID=2898 RepID=F2HI90_9CRYP|nr:hypothetical protein CPARA_3gp356 [Cryptomonas paramecium]AEA39014.1 hypothetical protein CPARA_3gp356 [Cryptomonas paramecium]
MSSQITIKKRYFFLYFFFKKNIFFPRQNKIFNIKNNCIPVKECLYHQKTFVNLIKSIVYKFTTKKHMVWLYFNKKKDKFHRYSIFLYFLNTKIKLFNFLRKVEMKAFLVHGINRTT